LRAGRCVGAIPTTAVMARSSPTTTTSAAVRAAATSSTRFGSTVVRRPCAAPRAATPTAPGPRSAESHVRLSYKAPASAGAFIFLPARRGLWSFFLLEAENPEFQPVATQTRASQDRTVGTSPTVTGQIY